MNTQTVLTFTVVVNKLQYEDHIRNISRTITGRVTRVQHSTFTELLDFEQVDVRLSSFLSSLVAFVLHYVRSHLARSLSPRFLLVSCKREMLHPR